MKLIYHTFRILSVLLIMCTISSGYAVPTANPPVDDPDVLQVSVYPNPSNGDYFKINITRERASAAEIKIYSALGDVILTEIFPLYSRYQTVTLNPADKLKEGVYMISIKTSEAQVTRRIIVRN